MDRRLLKKYKLEEAQKRFQDICEYTFITTPSVNEDDDDDENLDDGDKEANTDPGVNGREEMNGNPESHDDPKYSEDNVDDNDNDDAPNDGSVETTQMEDDDEVIDVDDMVSSQEETEAKVDGIDNKLVMLLKVVNKFQTALERNSRDLESLKSEFEKRNPTETEKLNLRSLDSYPYTETPKKYWENGRRGTPNYQVMYDNDVPTDKEQERFDITYDDANCGNDMDTYRSMSLSDFLKL